MKTSDRVKICELQVIGYADVLAPHILPSVTPPVFCRKDNAEAVLFPPFRLDHEWVLRGTWDSRQRFDSFVATEDVTRLDTPFNAKPNHELWIDEQMQHHYEPITAATKHLQEIAKARLEEAVEALRLRDLDQAFQLATTSYNADTGKFEPLAVKAAIALEQQKMDHYEVYAQTVARHCTQETFRLRVDAYRRQIGDVESRNSDGLMIGLAAKHPDEELERLFRKAA